MFSLSSSTNPASWLRQGVKYFAALAGISAALVLVISYFFHSTSVEVVARVDSAVAQAIESGGNVALELHDRPVGGILLERYELSADQISVIDGTAVVSISERTRSLPDNSHVQLCIDPDGDGHANCTTESLPGDGEVSDIDVVSCTRQQLAPQRDFFSSSSVSYATATCQEVQAPLIGGPGDVELTLGDVPSALALVAESDVSELINEALIERGLDEDVRLQLDDVALSVQGLEHDDDQRLFLDATELTISNGNTVDLSSFLDDTDTNTDDQAISASLSGTTLTVLLENGGETVVDLSSLTTDTDDQTLDLAGDEIVLSNGDGPDSAVDLSRFLDDTDTLTTLDCAIGELAEWNGTAWACTDVNALETLTTVGYDVVTQTITFAGEDGNLTTVPVTSLETTTILNNTLAVGNVIGTYTNEDGAAVDILESVTTLFDNGDQTFSFTAEDGSVSTLDATDLETLTTVTNTIVAGNTIATYTDEDGVSFDIAETITAIVDNGDGTFSFTHEDGSVSTLDVADLETLTTVTNTIVGNTIATYTDEDGVTFDIAETITTLVDNGDGTFTFTHEDGGATTLDVADFETLTTVTNTIVGNTIATYTDEDGVTFDIDETITALTDNGDGTFTFTHEDGGATTLDVADFETLTTVTNTIVGNTIATYTDEDGVTFDIDETITALTDNGDGTFTFTHEDGGATTLDTADLETLTTVTNTIVGNTIATYTDEDGVAFDIDETITTLVDNGDGTFTFTHEDGVTSTIDAASLETLTTLTSAVTGNLIGTYTDEDGVSFDLDETITTLVDNGDGTFTFTAEGGAVTTIDAASLETLTTVTQLVTGNTIATYTDEDGVAFDIDETITTLVDNGDGTFTFTAEGGAVTTIDAASLETLTTVTNTLDGNLIGTYTDEDGVSFDLDETITTLVDNGDGTFTFTAEGGAVTTIDAASLETLTTVTQLVTGNTIATYTDEDGVAFDIDETITTLVDNGDGTFTFTAEGGAVTTIDAASLETLTTVTNTLDGNLIGTYTDEDGVSFDLDETITTLVDNGDGTFTFTAEGGAVTTIDAASLETLTTVTNTIAGNTIATYTDEDGVAFDIDETITTLVDNGDGTFTFTAEGGAVSTIDAASLETLTTVTNTIAGNTIATYTDEDGVAFDIDETITALVDNGDGTFSFTHEDGVTSTIDAASLETLTTLTSAVTGNLIGTYTDEDGVSFGLDETITTLVDNGDGTFTFTAEGGAVTTIDAASLETLTTVTQLVTGNTIATYTDEDAVAFDIDETITTLVDNGDGTFTFTAEGGAVTTIDAASLETLTTVTNTLDGNLIGTYTDEDGVSFDLDETITTLVDNGDGTFTFTAEGGAVTTIDAASLETLTTVTNTLDGNLIGTYTDEDGVSFDLDETITTLVDNGDGTFTFTAEGGAVTTIDAASLETLTTVTNTLDGNLIGTYTDEDGVSFDLDETITTLVDNGDGTFTFTAEGGAVTTIDAASLETLTTVTNTIAGNTIATYTDEDGVAFDIDETITALVDNGDGTFTYTPEDGIPTTIDAASLETLTTLTSAVTGNTIATYTDEDGVPFDLDETITTLVDNGDGTFTFTAEGGAVTTIDAASLETLTTLTSAVTGNLIGTYTDEDGVSFDIDETITTLVDNGDGTFTFTAEGGAVTTIDAASLETLTTVTQLVTGNTIATYTDEDGVAFDIDETITTLVDNGDGTFTFTAEGGAVTTIDAASLETLTTVTNTLDGNLIGTYTDEDGVSFDLDETITTLVDNGDGTFTFTAEGGAVTTIDAASLETLTTVTNTLDGNLIGTYTDEDGVSFDLDETITTLVDNGDGTFTFTAEGGAVTTIDAASLETLTTVTNTIAGNTIATYTDEDGVAFDIDETITALVDNGDGTFTYTPEDGIPTTIDAASLETLTTVTNTIAGNTIATYTDEDGVLFDIDETITTLVDNGDGTFTFTAEGGAVTTIDAASLETLTTVTNTIAGNTIATYTDEDGVPFDIDETITTLVDNGDGTFTFTAEGGAVSTIDAGSLETLTTLTSAVTGNLIGTYTDEDGVSFDIDESITTLADNGDGTFTFTSEDGTVTTVDTLDIETITSVTQIITGNRIAEYVAEDGTVFDIDESITTLTDNGDGTFTFTSEDGTVTTVDTLDIETITSVTQIVTGNTIAEYVAEDGTVFDIDESITTLTDNGDGTFTFTSEDGTVTTVDTLDIETLTTLSSTLAVGNLIGTYTNEGGVSVDLNESITTLTDNGDGTFTFTSEDNTVTTIDTTDVETLSTIVQVITQGQTIATYTNEAGASIDILESVTELVDNGDGTYSFTSEDGTESTITDGDTLGALNCAVGETAQFDGTAWACAPDNDTDTDDQQLSNFTLTGSTLQITIEDGNTVDVDLSSLDTDTDTDDQTLTLAGSVLSISEGNSVDLAALVASGDSQTLSVSGGSIRISNGNQIDFPVLTIYEETYAGGSDDGLSQTWGRNLRMERTGNGLWTVVFATPHPDGTDYAVSFSAQEGTQRDSVLIHIFEGSKTATGFDLYIGTGDNGGTADILVNNPFTVSVDGPIDVLGPAN